jgi:Caspase domain
MQDLADLQRRQLLGLVSATPLAAGLAAWAPAAQAAQAPVPTDLITIMYRRESEQAPARTEPVVQAATLALEREFKKRGLRVLQPTAEVYKLLDQGQGVVLTFAPDAGFSLVFSAYADVRPVPGQEAGIGEVRLATRVFVGRHILVADEGRGQMFTRLEPAVREFGMRRALELAAQKAATDVADKAMSQLRDLTPERINELAGVPPGSAPTAQTVPLPQALKPVSASALSAAPMRPVTAVPLSAPRNRYAVVVGMSNYAGVRAANKHAGITDLPGVAKDTTFVVDSLGKLGFASERITVLRDSQATGTALRSVIKSLAAQVQPDDAVLIFISGHGVDKDESASGFGMPVLADYRLRDPAALDFWELQSFVKNLRGRVVWINDTCHSGGAATNVASVVVSGQGVQASVGLRGPDAATVAGQAGAGQDFAILTACAPNELSLETAEGGLFTTTLFKALVQTKGQVPLGQLFADNVAATVVERSRQLCKSGACDKNPQQTPIMAFNGNGAAFRL